MYHWKTKAYVTRWNFFVELVWGNFTMWLHHVTMAAETHSSTVARNSQCCCTSRMLFYFSWNCFGNSHIPPPPPPPQLGVASFELIGTKIDLQVVLQYCLVMRTYVRLHMGTRKVNTFIRCLYFTEKLNGSLKTNKNTDMSNQPTTLEYFAVNL